MPRFAGSVPFERSQRTDGRTGRHDHHQIRVSGCAPDLAPAETAVPPCRGRSGLALAPAARRARAASRVDATAGIPAAAPARRRAPPDHPGLGAAAGFAPAAPVGLAEGDRPAVVTTVTVQIFEQSTTCGSCPLVSGSHAHSTANASRGEFVKIRRALMAVAGGPVDGRMDARAGPAQALGHDPLSEGSVPMSRRSSVSRMRENRTYGLKGGWGNGPLAAPRP